VRSECKGVVDVCAWNFEGVMGLGFYVDGGVGVTDHGHRTATLRDIGRSREEA